MSFRLFLHRDEFDVIVIAGLTILSMFRIGLKIPFEIGYDLDVSDGTDADLFGRGFRLVLLFVICIPIGVGCILFVSSETVDRLLYLGYGYTHHFSLLAAAFVPAVLLTSGFTMSMARDRNSLRYLLGSCFRQTGVYLVGMYILVGLIAGLSEGWTRI